MQNAFLTPKEEKPLITCKDCKNQECLKTKKVCKKIESYLHACQAKDGYSDRHYRRKIRLFPTDALDMIGGKRAFKIKYGSRKMPKHLEEEE